TADDTTAFHEVIPANHLQRLLWAEAERLDSLVVDEANFKSERSVVEEELRQRVLADPYGRFFRLMITTYSYAVHPYKRPGPGPRTVTGYGPNVPLPALAITCLTPKVTDPDSPALTVLDAILSSGKSSRLYNSLVYDKQIAAQIFSSADLQQQAGLFYVGAVMASGKTLEEGEAALRAQVAALRSAPPSAADVNEAKNELIAGEVRQRETLEGRGLELGQAIRLEGDAARV